MAKAITFLVFGLFGSGLLFSEQLWLKDRCDRSSNASSFGGNSPTTEFVTQMVSRLWCAITAKLVLTAPGCCLR
jgi:hypothetical protein